MEKSVQEFHENCRHNWNTHNCPICFYIKNPKLLKVSICMKCGTKKSLYFCIICGHVGCGADVKNHALVHYRVTGHVFIMGVKDFEVWDMRLHKNVHRISGDNLKALKAMDNCHTYVQDNVQNDCSCAVCLYKRSPKLQKSFACMTCDENQPENLWICLSCSHIGCGRNRNHHAKNHYSSTHHTRVMQLQNYSVWDYKDHKYLHSQMHKTGAVVQSETEKYCSQQMKESCFIPTTVKYIGHKEKNCNRPKMSAVATATTLVVATDDGYYTERLPSAVEILQRHHQEFVKRIECLERQWQEIDKLRETNKRMITIEKRLLTLTDEKKVIEEKLHEHDAKLNKLLTQFTVEREDSPTVNNAPSDEVETVTSAAMSSVCDKTPKINSRNCQTQFVYLMILGLSIYYVFVLILQTAFEGFKNLFNF